MTDIMKLADDYAAKNRAVANVIEQGTSGELIEADGDKKRARAALKSAIEALQEENALLEGTLESRERNIAEMQAENERLKSSLFTANRNNIRLVTAHLEQEEKTLAERDALQAKLDAMGKGEAVIDFTVLHQFASDQAISYNKLCTAVRMCLAAPKALAPLSYAEIEVARREWLESGDMGTAYHSAVRFAERHHGIGGTP